MINLKSPEEIKIMQLGGQKLRKVMAELRDKITAGVTTQEIDQEAERLIKLEGGESSFKKVPNYYWTTCLCINDQVVHTPPSKQKLQVGDLFTIDIGMYYQGFHTDYSDSFIIGEGTEKKLDHFLETGKKALNKAIKQVKVGNRLGQVSAVIEKEIYSQGFFILKDLTGHGVGKKLHEDPFIPGYLDRPLEKTMVIKPGLVVAIEVIYSQGTEKIAYEKGNEWSIVSSDGSLTACFEHTVAVKEKNSFILT